jgi:predicted metalloprotease with PDZ domain
MRRRLFALSLALAASYPFGAFGIGVAEPNEPAPVIAYTISIPQPQTHLFHIAIEGKTICLSMPVWSTGYYHVDDFAGSVTEFEARTASGQELEWKKSDKNTWAIESGGVESLRIEYKVYARRPFIVHSFVDARAGHILGSSLLMSLDRYKSVPVSLALDLPEGWKVSNGAIPPGEDPFRFDFPSYHALVDTPMLIGNHKEYTYEVAGIPHVVAIEGESDLDHQAFVEGTRKLAEAARGLFGGLPYEKYCFILFLGPGMRGGLEHLNGTTMGSRPWGFSQDPMRLERLLDLTSHEYFHTWNVKRIQPDVFKPYDYDRETETGFLWFSEGVTDYYTDQLLLRAGIYTPEIVLRNLAELIGETRSTPGRLYQSAFASSFDTWITPHNENWVNATISYYPKGEIAGLVIDLEIMKRTQAEKSFDDVLLAMWKAYQKEDAGFDTEEIRALCEKTAGGSFEQIFDDYVYGVREVPFEEILEIAGYELITDEDRVKKEQKGGYLGANFAEQEGKVKVTSILRDTEVWRDGLNFDDEIIAVNGIRIESVTDLDYQLQIRKPGDEVTFVVGRSGLVKEIQVTLEEYPVPIYKIVDVERPTDLQLKIRKKWFKQ